MNLYRGGNLTCRGMLVRKGQRKKDQDYIYSKCVVMSFGTDVECGRVQVQ